MRILVIEDIHSVFFEILQKEGFTITSKIGISKDECSDIIHDFDILVIRSAFYIDKPFIEKAKNLKCIARAGAGTDNLDEVACAKYGIEIINAPEGNRTAVAEQVLGGILSLLNNIHLSHNEVINNEWNREKNRGKELNNKTIGIIGYGNNGSITAKLFAAFGCKVLVYDKYKTGYSTENIKESTLEEIKNQAEIISLHFPLTEETEFFINDDFVNSVLSPFYLINASRGTTVSLSSINKGIINGKILGAYLDVLECEPILNANQELLEILEELKNSNKVLFTPHVAGWTTESYYKIAETLARKLANLQK